MIEERAKRTRTSGSTRITKIGDTFIFHDPILAQSKIDEAREMSQIYPFIYILENSIREFIQKLMIFQFGENWWEEQTSSGLKKDVADRMADDKRDCWHQRRGARHIDYLDLKDLPYLVNKLEKLIVPDIIPSLEWFRTLVNEVYKSRCVVCHMNPLDRNNIDAIKVRFNHWEKQLEAKKTIIEKLTDKKILKNKFV